MTDNFDTAPSLATASLSVSRPIEVHPAATFLAKFPEAIQRAASSKPLPVADRLMDVPGALGIFVDYCNATAISPQPFLALAAGITAIGALAGRQYRTHTDARTNIYTVGVADSGGGKGHARSMVRRLFFAAGLTQYLGGDDVASGAAIHTALTRHPSILFQIDEFGDWLGEVLSANAAPYRKQINQRLKTLYSEAGSVVAGTEYADQTKMGKPREDIINPHVCLYGTTTPGQFWRAIGSGSLEDGLMARFLVFISPESYPDERDPALLPMPSGLIEAFQAIASGAGEAKGNLAGVMASNIKPEPYTVPMTAGAEDAYYAMRKAQLAKQRANEGSYITSIAGRMAENAIKLSLVRSISRDARRPVIDETDIAWGRALAEHCIDTILREASENVADTTYGRHVSKALQLVRRHGPISEAELFRRGWNLPARDRGDILRIMVEAGMVEARMSEGGYGKGRPTIWYSIPEA